MNVSRRNPTRRHVVRSMVAGSLLLPGILHELLAADARRADSNDPLAPKPPHFQPKAKSLIFIFLTGGVSHIDTFDPKPSGPGRDGNGPDKLMGCVFPYRRDPVTGIEIADIFSNLRSCLRDMTIVRSMRSAHFDHTEATLGMHTCSATFARPSYGSWLSYGLGTENRDLPSFMVLAPHLPYGGTQIYSNDFLPAYHQGTRIIPGPEPIADLRRRESQPGLQRMELDLTRRLNLRQLERVGGDSALAARIRSFETAFRMQTAAPEAFDLSRESMRTLEDYSLRPGQTNGFGWQCLVARRLVERGVRVVELVHSSSDSGVNWDTHSDMRRYQRLAGEVDRPIAALIRDLKHRGLLDETIVVIGTEFGRTPMKDSRLGRNHHANAFSIVLAGGGFKKGHVHGQTDDRGAEIVSGTMTVYDLHATILHQMGLDHERLTYRYAGRDFRLTDVHGRVVREILA